MDAPPWPINLRSCAAPACWARGREGLGLPETSPGARPPLRARAWGKAGEVPAPWEARVLGSGGPRHISTLQTRKPGLGCSALAQGQAVAQGGLDPGL